MTPQKKQKLQRLGYRVTDAKAFLNLSDEEMALIDLKISLIKKLRDVRKSKMITQKTLAKLLRSSQPRVAMLERGAADVSLDLICRALLVLGVPTREIGKTIASRRAA
jgi:DNA-binding XRE family transcriptional regulator